MLTGRELLIAELVASGRRTKQVAAELHLSPRTVESHLARIYRKLQVTSRAELAAQAGNRTPGADPGPPVPGDITMPATRYARSGEFSVAYQVAGDGPVDIVVTPGLASHLEVQWEQPQWRRFVSRLSTVGRTILFDKRGTGLSDPIPGNRAQSIDERIQDISAVMDAAGSTRALLFGISEGGPMSLYFAAAHPERVAGLLLYGTSVLPQPETVETRNQLLALMEAAHGTGQIAARMWPSLAETPAGLEWLARLERYAVSPGMLRAIMSAQIDVDGAGVLPAVRVPVTIVNGHQDPLVPIAEAEEVARRLPHARFVPIDVVDHVPWGEVHLDTLLDELGTLALSADWNHEPAAVLLTVAALSAGADPATVRRVRNWITSAQGRILTEDGGHLLVEFDGPATAVRCVTTATALDRSAVRGAVAIGEVRRGPGGIIGPPVDQVTALVQRAAPGQVMVSRAVRALLLEDQAAGLEDDDDVTPVRVGADSSVVT